MAWLKLLALATVIVLLCARGSSCSLTPIAVAPDTGYPAD